ncbi:hypothetical protein ABZ614_46170 [Streptomyces sp. NPDC013178]|uniref:hypothetical protein n=1 Tax=Streptomyces sp. NPDC013178 TaxID=3155118 RepID=UPI0034067523
MPRLTLPPAVITQDREPLHQHRRLAMLRRVLNDDSLPLRAWGAGALVLVAIGHFLQPVALGGGQHDQHGGSKGHMVRMTCLPG